MTGATLDLTSSQLEELRRYADGEPHRFPVPHSTGKDFWRPNANLIRRGLLDNARSLAGPGYHRITSRGRDALNRYCSCNLPGIVGYGPHLPGCPVAPDGPIPPNTDYTDEEWEQLWHHLCARRAELNGILVRLNRHDVGWGDERLGDRVAELDRLIAVAYARSH